MTPIFQTRSTATTHDVPAAVPVARPAFVALDPRQDPRQDPGRTNLSVQGNIHIHYDAQLRDVLCCTRLQLCFECREITLSLSKATLQLHVVALVVGTETAS
jgi:hypothetical protein